MDQGPSCVRHLRMLVAMKSKPSWCLYFSSACCLAAEGPVEPSCAAVAAYLADT